MREVHVKEIINKLARGDHNLALKEPTRMKDTLNGEKDSPNFWWDIENNWIAVLSLTNAQKIIKALQFVAASRAERAIENPPQQPTQQPKSKQSPAAEDGPTGHQEPQRKSAQNANNQ